MIRAIEWHAEYLAVLTTGDRELLRFFQVTTTNLQPLASIHLPDRGGTFASDTGGTLVVIYKKTLVVVDMKFDVKTIKSNGTCLTVRPETRSDFGQSRVLRRNVDEVFVCGAHSLPFMVSRFRILISALSPEARPLFFRPMAPIPIGVDPALSGLVQVRGGQLLVSPYSEFGARVHLAANADLAADLLKGNSPSSSPASSRARSVMESSGQGSTSSGGSRTSP
jgi:hypothetical protein